MTPVPLLLHNTLSGREEPFQPVEEGRVKMYVCGVTPYDVCHLGHARCYVAFDFIRRGLRHLGYDVEYVQNFTDVDDKIIKRAAERNEEPSALTERYIADYFEKMDALNVLRAGHYPRVTQHIPQIVKFVERLVANGFAYPVEGDVYYEVRRFERYGRLSKRSLDELQSGARVGVDERKRDPLDFALWKAAKPGEPSWDSPWGPGRPGWHIECSVMSIASLKTETFDIHGGGQDLVFPHHENEIAQAEGATGKTFARYWMHNGFVTVNKEKMSKSLGNFFSLADIFKKYEPRVVRLMLLSQHYRSPLEFSDKLLDMAAATLAHVEGTLSRALSFVNTAGSAAGGELPLDYKKYFEEQKNKLTEALADDFNSPKALSVVFGAVQTLSTYQNLRQPVSDLVLKTYSDFVKETLDNVFGLRLNIEEVVEDRFVNDMLLRRERAREEKNWSEADRIRKELADRGITIEDTPTGSRLLKKKT
ncbi:MAG TPA: cysteine--tRNA ligase [Elusimicrobiota bacterium]|nr:cysteine--tRNA ligase [Elusimicrobiota bacterium]